MVELHAKVFCEGVSTNARCRCAATCSPLSEGVCSGRVAQNHEQFVRTCRDEVVACGQVAQYDTCQTLAAVPVVEAVVDVVGHGDGTSERLCNVRHTGLPGIRSTSETVELQLVGFQINDLTSLHLLTFHSTILDIDALVGREGIVDGDDEISQRHIFLNIGVDILVVFIAPEQEGVVVFLDEERSVVVFISHSTIVDAIDVVDGKVAQIIGDLITTDTEGAISTPILRHGEHRIRVVHLVQLGVVLIELIALAVFAVERVAHGDVSLRQVEVRLRTYLRSTFDKLNSFHLVLQWRQHGRELTRIGVSVDDNDLAFGLCLTTLALRSAIDERSCRCHGQIIRVVGPIGRCPFCLLHYIHSEV